MLVYFYAAVIILFSATSTSAFGKFSFQRILGARRIVTKMAASDFYSIVEKDSKGASISFDKFKGKVVYGVNVASKCGYTASGYALLERISAMKDKGVEVLILPCNQFGGQEPGTMAEIENFCAMRNVKGANVLDKADVNGPNTRPVYKYMKENGVLGDIAWNFAGKFIVDKNGNAMPVKSEKDLEKQIQSLL